MRIDFERTGGFAGMRLRKTFETASLPAGQARQLEKLVAAAHFFDLPEKLETARPGADRFIYKIMVESDDRVHTVQAAEAALPAGMRPLIEWLTQQTLTRN